jgi:hypothetical protein
MRTGMAQVDGMIEQGFGGVASRFGAGADAIARKARG